MTTQTAPPPLPICYALVELARDALAGDPETTEATLAAQIEALVRPDRIAGIAAWALVRFEVERDAHADALEQLREHEVTAGRERREREAAAEQQADLITELRHQLDTAIQGRDRLALELEQARADLAAAHERGERYSQHAATERTDQ